MSKQHRDPGTWLYPLPVVLVSCQGTEGPPNIITAAWAGTVNSDPPMVSVSVQPPRHSHALIRERGEFVINIPKASQVELVDRCGTLSGRDEDKYAACGFTPLQSQKVSVPGIAECPVQLECKVRHTLHLGTHDMFVAEILGVTHDSNVVEQGRINLKAADPLMYGMGRYFNMGTDVALHGVSRRKD